MELMTVMFIAALLGSSLLLDVAGRLPEMKEDKAVSDMIALLRNRRLDAVSMNQPITWWIDDQYLAWWIDDDEDGLQEPGEVDTLLLCENITYWTYPLRGTFDGRGEHSTDVTSFPGMIAWLYGDTSLHIITVSANGQVDADTY